ncbi:nitroreductase family protein [Marinifilum sp. D714]|uniref:nitroreductase family protein n=1 Tax=Marinifilum sp. D714 TaxID=2937523 RepID=UPI0027C20092|nr:nitroreductase family protein [Marinifilum sp. D714]MDQ2177971.1 nitroreductase family protein [Marinifilum sp. D714]
MDFRTIIENRYSVRSYQQKEVEEEKLIKILEAGQLAPSAVNNQPWHFIVIREPDNHAKFSEIYHRDWFKEAPVYMIVCGDHNTAWKRKEDGKDHADIDAAIAIDHMTLQATELGLGTCWICNFYVEKCREFFQLPKHIEPIAILSLGYPSDDKIPAKKRKSLNEIVHWEKF